MMVLLGKGVCVEATKNSFVKWKACSALSGHVAADEGSFSAGR
jgi:hypothetical protein